MEIRIHNTGSHGNFSSINSDLIIDLGVSGKRIGEFFPRPLIGACGVLITHCHTDHANPPAFNKLYKLSPALMRSGVYAGEETIAALEGASGANMWLSQCEINVVHDKQPFSIVTASGVYNVTPHIVPHGTCECFAYEIVSPTGENILWATDFESTDALPDKMFDWLCIEGSWDTDLLNEGLANPETAFHAQSAKRHLSVQDFEKYCLAHIKPDGNVIQLHMSQAFGIRSPINTTKEV